MTRVPRVITAPQTRYAGCPARYLGRNLPREQQRLRARSLTATKPRHKQRRRRKKRNT